MQRRSHGSACSHLAAHWSSTSDNDSLGRAIGEVVLSKKMSHPNVVQASCRQGSGCFQAVQFECASAACCMSSRPAARFDRVLVMSPCATAVLLLDCAQRARTQRWRRRWLAVWHATTPQAHALIRGLAAAACAPQQRWPPVGRQALAGGQIPGRWWSGPAALRRWPAAYHGAGHHGAC